MNNFYLDTETEGLNPYKDKLVLFGYAYDDEPNPEIQEDFIAERVFEDKLVVGHNLNFDLLFLHYAYIKFVNCKYFDTQIFYHMLDPHKSSRLKDLGERLLGRKVVRIKDFVRPERVGWKAREGLIKIGCDSASGYGWADPTLLREYLIQDVELTRDLYRLALSKGIPDYYWEVEAPMIPIIFNMEIRGLGVSEPRSRALLEEFKGEQLQLEKYFDELKINPRSTKQLRAYYRKVDKK